MKTADIKSRRVSPLDDREKHGQHTPLRFPVFPAPKEKIEKVGGFKIEEDIPIPATGRGSGVIDALSALEPGQSIFKSGAKTAVIPPKMKDLHPDRHYVSRKVEGGVRIWRKN